MQTLQTLEMEYYYNLQGSLLQRYSHWETAIPVIFFSC